MSTQTDFSLLLQQARELIYTIAAEDANVYNVILRLCRATAALFPLSLRLDYMIAFGVTVRMKEKFSLSGIYWYWGDKAHDIFGPAKVHDDGDTVYYYRGRFHRHNGPARVWHTSIQWAIHGNIHRDYTAPSGTGVKWLAGAASIVDFIDYSRVIWCDRGKITHELAFEKDTDEYTQIRAEMNYWIARG
jgi:hypothetical protein